MIERLFMKKKENLSVDNLKQSANNFTRYISKQDIAEIRGATDGKAVGNYLENAFKEYLKGKFNSTNWGNSAKGIDLPTINTDIKFTSYRQPQSSLPFKSTAQKVFGLGYNLIVFVYHKDDDQEHNIQFPSATFIEESRTADFTLTRTIINAVEDDANKEDIYAIMKDRGLPGDDIVYGNIVNRIIDDHEMPNLGYITISNALQWRAQYSHAIEAADEGNVDGVEKLNAE